MKNPIRCIFSLLISIIICHELHAQCIAPPAAGACAGANGSATDGVNINSGQTFWVRGTKTFASGINLNGGTLRVCGDLTLSNMNFNSGTILISPGATLTINGGGILYFNGNCTVSNMGTLNINRSIAMQNANNILFNATSTSILNMNGGNLEINSPTSNFVNNGLAYVRDLFVQGSGSTNCVCLGLGSILNLSDLKNNFLNSLNAPSGKACVTVSDEAALNANLANTPNVNVCMKPGSSRSGGAGFGSATVSANCSLCGIILSVKLAYFRGSIINQKINLEWGALTQINTGDFTVEKSKDGIQWSTIGNKKNIINSNPILNYKYNDENPCQGIQYYRIKQTSPTGEFAYSSVLTLKYNSAHILISIYPNPNNTNRLNILGINSNAEPYLFELKDMSSKLLFKTLSSSNSIILPHISKGIYFIIINKNIQTNTFKYIVE